MNSHISNVPPWVPQLSPADTCGFHNCSEKKKSPIWNSNTKCVYITSLNISCLLKHTGLRRMQSMTAFRIAVEIHLKYGPLTKRTLAKATLCEMCCLHVNLLRDVLTYILYDESKGKNKHTKNSLRSNQWAVECHTLFTKQITNQIKYKCMY